MLEVNGFKDVSIHSKSRQQNANSKQPAIKGISLQVKQKWFRSEWAISVRWPYIQLQLTLPLTKQRKILSTLTCKSYLGGLSSLCQCRGFLLLCAITRFGLAGICRCWHLILCSKQCRDGCRCGSQPFCLPSLHFYEVGI